MFTVAHTEVNGRQTDMNSVVHKKLAETSVNNQGKS